MAEPAEIEAGGRIDIHAQIHRIAYSLHRFEDLLLAIGVKLNGGAKQHMVATHRLEILEELHVIAEGIEQKRR